MTRPIASLSLDLDNKWSYLKTHGDPGWESFPSYLNLVVPRVLKLLEERTLKITFFIVGQDAALEKNREALAAISRSGHEIASHSFNHEPWLHLYSEEEIEVELQRAEQHIEGVTGYKPIGFRGPGFSLSLATLKVLAKRGYLYDATTLPTFIGPLARAYYLLTARMSAEERAKRKLLFGSLSDGLRSIKPYKWKTDEGTIIEIPVTTMPILRAPFHLSYILYLSGFSGPVSLQYFKSALALCKLTGVSPSILLHPLDFLGREDDTDLTFFPAMRIPRDRKLEVVGRALDIFQASYDVMPIHQHARRTAEASNLSVVSPNFRNAQEAMARGLQSQVEYK